MNYSENNSNTFLKQGFTLVEMMVVIAIFGIFTLIIVLDYNKFGEREKFSNFTYDVALDVRQTQVNGIAVRGVNQGADAFSQGAGIHFEYDSNTSSYSLFADSRNDQVGLGNGVMEVFESMRRVDIVATNPLYRISKICVFTNGVPQGCSGNTGKLDIVFQRPNPDAIITYNGIRTYTSAEVTLTYTRNGEIINRKIVMDTTGQISLQAVPN